MDIKGFYNQALFFYVKHRKHIALGIQSVKTIFHFIKKNYVESVASLAESITNINNNYWSFRDVLRSTDGWHQLFSYEEKGMSELFNFSNFPFRSITVAEGTINFYSLTDTIEVVEWQSKYYDDGKSLLYNSNKNNKQEIIKFLIDDLFKSINSECVVLSTADSNMFSRSKPISLMPYELSNYASDISTSLAAYLKKSMSLNISRSIMLYSEPGTGKSCVAGAAVQQLGLKTLKIDNFNNINNSIIQLLINNLKFEAILIDDLDHMHINNNSSFLDFLERIRKQVKVIIATVNSTKAFHRALLRPGRFDKIMHIKSLDEQVIKKTLGDELIPYLDKVKEWPIAFINELAISHKLEENITVEDMIDKLQKRIGLNSKEDTIDLEAKPTETKTEEIKKEESKAA